MASKTILVIDADSETEQLIASTLESEGYLVFAVPGGDVGTEMAQKVSPSLIFINPDETGLEICKTIHEFESLQKVPIILLTSPSSGIDLRDVASFGVADFLDVPCTPGKLLEKTVKVLSTKAPIVLHVKEKERVPKKEESGTPDFLNAPATQQGKGARLEAPEMSGIPEFDEERESTGGPTREIAPDFSYDASPKEGTPRRKKKSNSPVVAAGLVIVIAGIAGFLFYTGTKKSVSVKPMSTAARPKAEAPAPAPSPSPAQSPAESPTPSNEQQKQQPVIESKAVPSPPAPAQRAAPSTAAKKEQVPVPAPAASPEKSSSKTAGKKTYSVQLGVFKSESNAAALAKQFKAKGYDTFMSKGTGKDNGTLYRVLIGKSEDRKESVKLAAKLRDEEKIKAIIYTE
ncbi:MAG: SPOR domain-containing protein [Thermodesulfovibrionales bacterium]